MKKTLFSRQAKRGTTLTEVLIAGFVSTLVAGAVISLSIAAIKTYYVDSDYLEIGAQQRRLTDDLVERGTMADDLRVLYDISDLRQCLRDERGDCFVALRRSKASPVSRTPAWGYITSLDCYYLAPIPGAGTQVALYHFTATVVSGQETVDAATALTNYTRSASRRLSGPIFEGSLPRAAPTVGVFTNNGFSSGQPPTVLVHLPSRVKARGVGGQKITSNITLAITPRI